MNAVVTEGGSWMSARVVGSSGAAITAITARHVTVRSARQYQYLDVASGRGAMTNRPAEVH